MVPLREVAMGKLLFVLLLAFAAPAMGQDRPPPMQPRSESRYLKVLKDVPTELRGFWCLQGKGESVTNQWTGSPAKEFTAHRCVINNKTAQIEKLPDLSIVDEYIHIRADARCHVEHVGKLPGIYYVLKLACINRSLHNPIFIGSDPNFLWLGRGITGDLEIIADIEGMQ
jgi:hypothetical protein